MLKIDTSYSNYDAIDYYKYVSLLQTPVEELLDKLLNELDSTILYKDTIVLPTNCWKYEDIFNKCVRLLFTIPLYDYKKYNHYVELLLEKHNKNIEFEKEFNNKITDKKSVKSVKKSKSPNKYFKYESTDLFTGELVYNYINYATGDDFYSSNPDLLEELNAPKKKKEPKKVTPRKDFGKIILNFKMK